jgi:hypothetical protein
MPVILRTTGEINVWLDAPISEALSLQISLPDDALKIVRSGEQKDEG